MKYPKYDIYEKLYKRYFEKGVHYLINKTNINENDKVLDLCGGNGRLTKELKKLTSNVTYLDQEKDMIPDDLKKLKVRVINNSVQEFLNNHKEKYDKVFCEQAVNYWLLDIDMQKFSNIFNKNALFIFNTFSNKPSNKPTIKEYSINDINYIEISYLVENKVYHVQIREGFKPHFTIFNWITEREFYNILSPYFDVQKTDDGKSALYVCRRK